MRGESRKWLPEEDSRLVELVTKRGVQDWDLIASHFDIRTAKQCRQRWIGHLFPGVRKDLWTPEEDEMLIELIHEFGPKWEKIQSAFSRRTGSEIKNHYMNLIRCEHQFKAKSQSHNMVIEKFDFETPSFGDDDDEVPFVPNEIISDNKTGSMQGAWDEKRSPANKLQVSQFDTNKPTAAIESPTAIASTPLPVWSQVEKNTKNITSGAVKMTSLFSLSRTSPPKTLMAAPPTTTQTPAPTAAVTPTTTAPTVKASSPSIGLFSLTPKPVLSPTTAFSHSTSMPHKSKCELLEADVINSPTMQLHEEAGLVPESFSCKQQDLHNQKGALIERDGDEFHVVELGLNQRKPHELPCIPHLLGRNLRGAVALS